MTKSFQIKETSESYFNIGELVTCYDLHDTGLGFENAIDLGTGIILGEDANNKDNLIVFANNFVYSLPQYQCTRVYKNINEFLNNLAV